MNLSSDMAVRREAALSRHSVMELLESAECIAPETIVADVKRRLEGRSPMSCLVVTVHGNPEGLVMSYDLDHRLSTPFGRSLYLNRPIANVMDSSALIIDAETHVGEIARQAMERPEARRYDNIIVTQSDGIRGTLSVQHLLEFLSRARGALELAGGVCHELNQPLQAVMGYAELALEEREKPAADALLHGICREVERLSEITRQLQQITSYETRAYAADERIVDLRSASQSSPEAAPLNHRLN